MLLQPCTLVAGPGKPRPSPHGPQALQSLQLGLNNSLKTLQEQATPILKISDSFYLYCHSFLQESLWIPPRSSPSPLKLDLELATNAG
ncbi:hypothetical protein Fmac_028207 [Flemingia macrophylla]|uniref:Uncharacterized protein n=1 Tax=Flemingia macrophylla TaxID=520843 RepID=A0ABD1L792_9FABA